MFPALQPGFQLGLASLEFHVKFFRLVVQPLLHGGFRDLQFLFEVRLQLVFLLHQAGQPGLVLLVQHLAVGVDGLVHLFLRGRQLPEQFMLLVLQLAVKRQLKLAALLLDGVLQFFKLGFFALQQQFPGTEGFFGFGPFLADALIGGRLQLQELGGVSFLQRGLFLQHLEPFPLRRSGAGGKLRGDARPFRFQPGVQGLFRLFRFAPQLLFKLFFAY